MALEVKDFSISFENTNGIKYGPHGWLQDIDRFIYTSKDKPDKPSQIIYNGTTTICIFSDGDKVIARPSNDDSFDPEVGVAMCIMKRLYGSRTAFQKAVDNGYRQD